MQPAPSNQPRILVPWGPREAAAGAIALLALTLAVFVIAWLAPGDGLPLWAVLSATVVLQSAMVGIAVKLGPARRGRLAVLFGPAHIGPFRSLLWAIGALLGSVVVSGFYVLIARAISEDLVPSSLPEGVDFHELRWFSFAVIVVLAPFAEEIFYRGFLFTALLQRFSLGTSVAISAGVFALSHGDPLVLAPTFIAGAVFALVYYRTRSLWPLVLAHMTQNALAFSISG